MFNLKEIIDPMASINEEKGIGTLTAALDVQIEESAEYFGRVRELEKANDILRKLLKEKDKTIAHYQQRIAISEVKCAKQTEISLSLYARLRRYEKNWEW